MRLCFALIFSAGFSLTLQALDDTSPDSPADLEATALEAAVVNSTRSPPFRRGCGPK